MHPPDEPQLIYLTFDVEMNSNFPYWTSWWDDRKGCIDRDTKLYIRAMNALAREYGVHFHYYLVGQCLESPELEYLEEAVADGHGIGNHTYTHLNMKAGTLDQLQAAYRGGTLPYPGDTARDVIVWELRRTNELARRRLGVDIKTFRTPGGFDNGLHDAEELQLLLQAERFDQVSSRYVSYFADDSHPTIDQLAEAIARSHRELRPYRYSSGLVEVPLAGITDIEVFRVLKLPLDDFIAATLRAMEVAWDEGRSVTNTCHPAVLASRDPHLRWLRAVIEFGLSHASPEQFVTMDRLQDHLLAANLSIVSTVARTGVARSYPGM